MVLEGLKKKLAEKLDTSPRIQEGWDRLHKEAGFIPVLNITDLEARRQQIKTILADIETKMFDPDKGGYAVQKDVVQKVFKLFWGEGDAWFRGLDNRELAEKVVCFLANCSDCGYLPPFMPDLFEEAMILLHFSFQEIDVTHTPVYLIESRPVVFPQKAGAGLTPETEIDAMGQLEMRNRIQELEGKLQDKEE